MRDKHCRVCGTHLTDRDVPGEGMIPYCPACDRLWFPNYNVAVIMLAVDEQNERILLIKQYGRPDYILVAGYVNCGEALEDAVVREIREETGLTVARCRFNRSKYFERSDALMCNFTAYIKDPGELSVNREVDDYRWFSFDEAKENIKPGSLAEEFLLKWLEERN